MNRTNHLDGLRGSKGMKLAIDSLSRQPNYHLAHNIGLPGVSFVRRPGIPLGRLPARSGNVGGGIYMPMRPQGQAFLHLWNKIRVGPGSGWGVTFESRLPRVPDGDRSARLLRRKLLEDPSLNWINAMSSYAYRRMETAFTRTEWQDLTEKVQVVYPRLQPARPASSMSRQTRSGLELVFVGADFFRKGGEAVLRLVEQEGERLDLRLTVVSSLNISGYATPWVDNSYRKMIAERLDRSSRITWHESLPHEKVLDVVSEADVCLLPSLADTFGYSLAEGLMAGALVVGTNVQALPEIVGAEGIVIDLPVNEFGEWVSLGSRNGYSNAMVTILEALVATMSAMRNAPRSFTGRRTAGRARALGQFGGVRDAQLASLYALSGVHFEGPAVV